MKKLFTTLLATISIASTAVFAGAPPPLNISEFDISAEFDFVAQCEANGEVTITPTVNRARTDTFTITSDDFHTGPSQAVYLVIDLDSGAALVLTDKDTGDILEFLDIADPEHFENVIDIDGAHPTRAVLSENLIFIQTFLSTEFILELEGYIVLLEASMELRVRGEPTGDYDPPKIKLYSKAMHGEGVADDIVDPAEDDYFVITSARLSASGRINPDGFGEIVGFE